MKDLIQRYLLDNPHGSVLTLNPSRGLNWPEKPKQLEDKLDAYLSSLSEEEKTETC